VAVDVGDVAENGSQFVVLKPICDPTNSFCTPFQTSFFFERKMVFHAGKLKVLQNVIFRQNTPKLVVLPELSL